MSTILNAKIYRPNTFSPDFLRIPSWIVRSEGLLGHVWEDPTQPDCVIYNVLDIRIDFNGVGHLFCGGLGRRINESVKCVFPNTLAGLTSRICALFGSLYDINNYWGMVDIGLAATNIRGSILFSAGLAGEYYRIPFDKDDFRKTTRTSTVILQENPNFVARKLVMPLVDALSQGHYDPFK